MGGGAATPVSFPPHQYFLCFEFRVAGKVVFSLHAPYY